MGVGLAAAAALPGTAAAQKVALGAWTVDARPDPRSLTCIMTSYFPADGKHLFFAVGPRHFAIAISDRRWTMPEQARFDVEYTLDGKGPYRARGVAIRPRALLITLESWDPWLELFRRSRLLGVTLIGADRYQYSFGLDSATPAFNRIFGCLIEANRTAMQAPSRAAVIAVSKSDDLALLKAEATSAAVAPFRPAPLRLGEQVVVFGFPLQGIVSSSGNLTTGNVAALAGYRDDHRLIQFTAPVQPGNSGGPVFDLRGHVIGIVVARLGAGRDAAGAIPQNINLAVKASVAQSFLEAQGIAITRGDSAAHLGVADVADKARPVTVKVECLPQ